MDFSSFKNMNIIFVRRQNLSSFEDQTIMAIEGYRTIYGNQDFVDYWLWLYLFVIHL